MFKYGIFTACLIISQLSGAIYQNGFENQNTAQWMPFKNGEKILLSTENPAEGNYSLKILPAGMKLKKAAMIPVVPGTVYQISAQLRAVSGRVRMSIAEFDQRKEWLKVGSFFVGETGSSSWRYIEKNWQPKSAKTRFITLQFNGGDGFADDIRISKFVPPAVKKVRKMSISNWKIISGSGSVSNNGEIRLENDGAETLFPVSGGNVYCFENSNQGEGGQRVLYYIVEYDRLGKVLNAPRLFSKINTGGGRGKHFTFFSTGENTAKVRITVKSVGKISLSDTVLYQAEKGKSPLKLNAAADRYFYYKGENGRLDTAVFNTGKRMERYSLLLRLTNDRTGETFVPEPWQMDHGGRVPGNGWHRSSVELPFSQLSPGSWRLQLHMINGGTVVDVQEHLFGIAPAPREELTRKNIHTRKEPVFFMMLSQWPDMEMFRKFRAWGFDVVEPDFTWGEVETAKGVYDWSLIDRTLEIAAKNDLKVAIKVMCWNLPADLKQRMISSNNDRGACPPNRGESLERLTALWKAIAERYRNHPQVVWYTVSVGLNDGPLHGSFGPCHSVKQCYDYSADNAANWGDYLKKHFTLDEVGKMYGRSFTDWQSIPLPGQEFKYDPVTNPVREENIFDHFMKYNASGVTDALTGIWQEIRRLDKDTPILWKAGGGYLERVPKGFEYDKLLTFCKNNNVIFTSTATPALTAEPLKIEYARTHLPQTVMAGEVGAEGERFPAPPLCTAKCFYLTMRYDMQIMGFCVYPSDVPPELWGYIKNLQGELRDFRRYSGRLRIYGDADVRTYSQRMLDRIYVGNSLLRKNMQHVEELNLPFAFVYDRTLDTLTADQVVYDPGTPFFPAETLKRLLRFVREGGTLIFSAASGNWHPGDDIAKLRRQAGEKRKLPLGKGVIYFPDDAREFAALSVKLNFASPIVWNGKTPLFISVMQNQSGDRKLILFNPAEKKASGTLKCSGELSRFLPEQTTVRLDAASLMIVNLKEK
ncbi:MAG: beta-galactosidase [Lentisphaeria bacterium]|nr:beta-galactosidase [Lentisphaeria bacterium]